jgi:hypothetical protein
MNIVHEIARWARTAKLWQSDAIRRIFTQDTLTSADEQELFGMLLAENGVTDPERVAPTAKAFADIVGDNCRSSQKVLLKEIHSVSGVNALIPDQSITFALNGLTVIYGENGAGKSGYARIFKHACHAREKSQPIHNDVRSRSKQKAQATIELSVDGDDIAVRWVAGSPMSDLLAEIAVFDSHCARVFLDDANEVVYLPYGMDVFGRLAALCGSLKVMVQQQIRSLPESISAGDQFGKDTAAGRFVATLSDKSDIGHMEKLIALTDVDNARMLALKNLVTISKTNSPKIRAAELRRSKQRIEQIRAKLIAIEAALSPAVATKLNELCTAAESTSEAARLASTEAFKADPLPGIGTDPWRLLFNAAKEFSEKVAYPGDDFPVVDSKALCVWCQQTLSPEASDRLTRFRQFVVDNATSKMAAAEGALKRALQDLTSVAIPTFANDDVLLEELRAHRKAVATVVEEYVGHAVARKNAIVDAVSDGSWTSIPSLPASSADDLKAIVDEIEGNAAELEKADNPEELGKLTMELAELEDRALLAKIEKEVRTLIAAKRRQALLRICERACDTTAITRFGSELMEKAVTDQLIAALKRETDFFGIKCVPLNVAKKGERGKTKHQLTIESGVAPSGVLSEGEQRVVAISAFLAELQTAGRSLPIVFDDPVSSLDHNFRERVAKRLVEEAKSRQVVVFTHDIVMLLALEDECGAQRVPPLVHTIRRSTTGPGECPGVASRPWHASSTSARIGFLKTESARFQKLSEQSPNEYRVAVADLFGKLREAWERAIEQWLFNDSVQRFRPSVETNRLKKVLVESADYAAIEQGMSKCSAELTGHDKAAAKSSAPPTPTDVCDAIAALENFVATIKKRQDAVARDADKFVEPPEPSVSRIRATKILDSALASAST